MSRPEPDELLRRNKAWSGEIRRRDPSYFPNLASQSQAPKILWIGCSDSRVSETKICNCDLGDIFTHRNIANLVHDGNDCVDSVIEYAVGTVKVEHVLVVGHSQCGGVKAAWQASKQSPPAPVTTPLTRWLARLVALSRRFRLNELPEAQALPRLTEENVKQQVQLAVASAPVRAARKEGRKLWVHGWIFQLENGELKEIIVNQR